MNEIENLIDIEKFYYKKLIFDFIYLLFIENFLIYIDQINNYLLNNFYNIFI